METEQDEDRSQVRDTSYHPGQLATCGKLSSTSSFTVYSFIFVFVFRWTRKNKAFLLKCKLAIWLCKTVVNPKLYDQLNCEH